MNDFDQLITDIQEEAQRDGPAAVAELDGFDQSFMIASSVLRARQEAHMTQAQLAQASGVQQAEISKIERGLIVPRVTTLNKLLKPLGRKLAVVDIDDERTAA